MTILKWIHFEKEWSKWITKNSQLKLKQEPTNEYDQNAVAIYTVNGNKLGYVPAFYSKAVFSLMENGAIPLIRVVHVNEKSHPHWWVKVDFECELPLTQNIQSAELISVMQ